MKSIALTLACGAALVLAPSLRAQQPDAMQRSAKQTSAQRSPQEFANQAAITNLAEVELGRLAQEKAENQDVKQFGEEMVQDHTDLESNLQDAAKQAGVSLPNEIDQEHQSLKNLLEGKSGKEFDRLYMEKMVAGHKKAVAMLENASQHLSNDVLKQWAADALPVVQDHLEKAQRITDELNGVAPPAHR